MLIKVKLQKMKGILWNHLLVLIIIVTGEFLFLTSCKKVENKPKIEYDTVIDIDGNSYKTVKIGDQWWMAENLKTNKLNDGTVIPLVINGKAWNDLTTMGYSNYLSNEKEYNWYCINSGKLCPTGWHIPTYDESTTLITYLGGEKVAGGKMKAKDPTFCENQINIGATNESGFSGIAYGYREGFIEGSYGFLNYSLLSDH